MNELESLRALARARRQSATRKVARHSRDNNISLAGTALDPRKAAGAEKRMNRATLRKYIGQLDQFNNRNVQYYGGRDGLIIPGKTWQAYKRIEARVGKIGATELETIGKLKLPGGQTVAQLQRVIVRSPSSNMPFAGRNRTPKGISSIGDIQKLIAHERDRLSPTYRDRAIKAARTSAMKMAESIGDTKAMKAIKKLDDIRLYIAWTYSNLADELSTKYYSGKSDEINLDDEFDATTNEVVHDHLKWAKKINVTKYGFDDPKKVEKKQG